MIELHQLHCGNVVPVPGERDAAGDPAGAGRPGSGLAVAAPVAGLAPRAPDDRAAQICRAADALAAERVVQSIEAEAVRSNIAVGSLCGADAIDCRGSSMAGGGVAGRPPIVHHGRDEIV